MENREIGRKFRLLAQLMEFYGEVEFKTRAVMTAALRMGKSPEKLAALSIKELQSQAGFNAGTAARIYELAGTGRLGVLDEYLTKTAPGIVELLGIRGLGPKKVLSITSQLEIQTPAELYYACNENRLSSLKGFGIKSQQDILELLEFNFKTKGQYLYPAAKALADEWTALLEKEPFVNRVEISGDLRRKCATIERIDLLVCCPVESLAAFLAGRAGFASQDGRFPMFTVHEEESLAVHFHVSNEADFALAWLLTTGNTGHLEKFQSLSGPYKNESEIYEQAGYSYVEPERREGLDEFSPARLPARPLVEETDLRGSIHNHSTYSDGLNTLEEMARECMAMGLEYLVICDHSQSAFYAGGLKPADVQRQHAEIDILNDKLKPFKIFKGIESDILGDGRLDYPDSILESFELVVASIHSNLRMDAEKATTRLLKAIHNPFTTVLGHPSGRLLLGRAGYPLDHERILEACSKAGVAIELNSSPSRMDIDWRWIPLAMSLGVKVSINPDAHNRRALHDVKYGVQAARKGGLMKEACLNAMNLEQFENFLSKKKSQRILG